MASSEDRATNLAHWEALAAVHGQDGYYDAEALIAGADSLTGTEDAAVRAAVGDVAGLDVLHLQCHIGFDSISLARRGARVTGADFSPASLAKARTLAERAGVEADFVEADATALPGELHERFDLVYSTVGVLCWIEDLAAWMRSVRSALRPGGRLVLVEIHPLLNMVGGHEPLDLDFPYAADGPHRFDEPGSYADPDADVAATTEVVYAHSLGETVTTAVDAGLRVDALHEHLDADRDPRGNMLTPEEDGRLRLRVTGRPLPILFTLLATRPSRGAPTQSHDAALGQLAQPDEVARLVGEPEAPGAGPPECGAHAADERLGDAAAVAVAERSRSIFSAPTATMIGSSAATAARTNGRAPARNASGPS